MVLSIQVIDRASRTVDLQAQQLPRDEDFRRIDTPAL
jgi:hypothetical protein